MKNQDVPQQTSGFPFVYHVLFWILAGKTSCFQLLGVPTKLLGVPTKLLGVPTIMTISGPA